MKRTEQDTYTIPKIRNLEAKVRTSFYIPNIMRKVYCLFKNSIMRKHKKKYLDYNEIIKKLYNKHIGERCFIVGMGPSLKSTNLDLIKDETIFGINRLFAGNFGINPQYWCVSDIEVFLDNHKTFLNLDTTLFLPEEAGKLYLDKLQNTTTTEPIVVKQKGHFTTWKNFSKDLTQGSYGGNVVFTCLQIAYYLGFKEVYLLGCDCDISQGMHFDDDTTTNESTTYWDNTFNAYKLAKKVFEEDDRNIYNSTIGGN